MEAELKTNGEVLKRVVKRKKAILCKTLKVTDFNIAELVASGVVNQSVAKVGGLPYFDVFQCVCFTLAYNILYICNYFSQYQT